AYLLIALVLTLIIHLGIAKEWISLKTGFHWKTMTVGAVVGVTIYLVVLLSGLSFASHGIEHVVVDLALHVLEPAVGGLLVRGGLIYDRPGSVMPAERAHRQHRLYLPPHTCCR